MTSEPDHVREPWPNERPAADADRLPEHARALELFRFKHFDTDTARLLARSELERSQGSDADELPLKPPRSVC